MEVKAMHVFKCGKVTVTQESIGDPICVQMSELSFYITHEDARSLLEILQQMTLGSKDS